MIKQVIVQFGSCCDCPQFTSGVMRIPGCNLDKKYRPFAKESRLPDEGIPTWCPLEDNSVIYTPSSVKP